MNPCLQRKVVEFNGVSSHLSISGPTHLPSPAFSKVPVPSSLYLFHPTQKSKWYWLIKRLMEERELWKKENLNIQHDFQENNF